MSLYGNILLHTCKTADAILALTEEWSKLEEFNRKHTFFNGRDKPSGNVLAENSVTQNLTQSSVNKVFQNC